MLVGTLPTHMLFLFDVKRRLGRRVLNIDRGQNREMLLKNNEQLVAVSFCSYVVLILS